MIKGSDITLPAILLQNNRKEYLKLIDKQITKIKKPFDVDNFFRIFMECFNEPPKYYDKPGLSLLPMQMDVYFILRYFHTYDIEKNRLKQ